MPITPPGARSTTVIGAKVNLKIGDRFVPVHGTVALDDADSHEGFEYRVAGRMNPMGNPWDKAIVASSAPPSRQADDTPAALTDRSPVSKGLRG